jgi:hypothetical protein
VLLVLVVVVYLDGPFTSTKVRRNEEHVSSGTSFMSTAHMVNYQFDFNNQLKNGSLSTSQASHRFVIKGKPHMSLPTPRSPTPLSQPTLRRPTLPPKLLHLFNKIAIKSTESILRSSWVTKLRDKLREVQSQNQVTVVFANSDYLESLLNWLIAAKVRLPQPVTNELVVCLDRDIFNVLNRRDIPSLYIQPSTVVDKTKLSSQQMVWMVRLVVFRLINYWGFDVASYDSDTVIMKNPQELFERHLSSDIVGSSGKFPHALGKKWGFTLCMGVILFRSTPRTGRSAYNIIIDILQG